MILEGTTSSGAVVPVQVTTDGKVVAEGRTGPEGPQGPEGPEGPQGPQGSPGTPGNLWSGSNPGPIYYTGGSVGIGTSVPGDYHLSSLVTYGGDGNGITIASSATTHEGRIYFADGTTGDERYRGEISYSHSTDSLGINTAAARAITIDSSQRVGIGTTTPQTQFVLSNGGAEGIEVGWDGSTSMYISAFNRNPTGWLPLRIQGSDIRFTISGGGNEKARIDSSGRLLVGTTTAPAGTLGGDVVCQGAVVLQSPNGTWWALEVNDNGTLSIAQTTVR